MLRVRTTFVYPPIPDRRWDWSAVDDATYDGPPCPVGSGRTENDAIADLLMMLEPDTLQTHFVTHGDVIEGATRAYAVISTRDGLVFEDDSKVLVIAEAQRRNGFSPVDGDESTYGRQVREAASAAA